MASATQGQPQIKSWFWASRPFSLSAAISPVLVGSALAADLPNFSWLLLLLTLSGSIAIQIGTNLTDEYADHRKHGSDAKLLAPHKVLRRGLLSEKAVLTGMIVSFTWGIFAGLVIVALTGWPILALGIASVLVAYLYAGGPYPLGNFGLGAPIVFCFMGPVMVLGAYYVQAQEFSWPVLVVSLPIALLVTAILHCNDLRDVQEDIAAGKRSLPGWIGDRPSRWVFALMVSVAYLAIAWIGMSVIENAWVGLGLLPVPRASKIVLDLFRAKDRPDMNRIMVKSAKLHGWTGVLLAAGIVFALR